MALLSRKKQLAAKIETTAGEAIAVAAADAAILAEDIRFNFNPTPIERNPLRASLSPKTSTAGPRIAEVTCRVEIKGSGTAGTAPSWGKLLQACGFAETGSSTKVYTVNSTEASTETLTMAVYNDGIRGLMYGARGNVTIDCDANNHCFFNFTFMGIFSTRENAAMLTSITYESTLPPIFYNAGLTFDFGTEYADCVFDTASIDVGNNVVVRDDANATYGLDYARITGRNPTMSMAPDTELETAKVNWDSFIQTPTTGTIQFDIGSTAGNHIQITAPAVQALGWTDSDRDGTSTDSLSFGFRESASAGDDELVITHM